MDTLILIALLSLLATILLFWKLIKVMDDRIDNMWEYIQIVDDTNTRLIGAVKDLNGIVSNDIDNLKELAEIVKVIYGEGYDGISNR
jgi:hypothetical protein